MKLVSCSLITQQPLPEVILTSGKIITVDDRSTITRPVGIKESASFNEDSIRHWEG